MAAILGLNRADVTVHPAGGGPDQVYEEANIVSRGANSRVADRRGGLLYARAGATAVTMLSRTTWRVEFGDGETWDVVKSTKGCGCAGGRG